MLLGVVPGTLPHHPDLDVVPEPTVGEEHRRLGFVGEPVVDRRLEVDGVDVPVEDREIGGQRRVDDDRAAVVDGVVDARLGHLAGRPERLDPVANQRVDRLPRNRGSVGAVAGGAVAVEPVVEHRDRDLAAEVEQVDQVDTAGVLDEGGDADRGGRIGAPVLNLADPGRKSRRGDAVGRARRMTRGVRGGPPVAGGVVVLRRIDDLEREPETVRGRRPGIDVVVGHRVDDRADGVLQNEGLAAVGELEAVAGEVGRKAIGRLERDRILRQNQVLARGDGIAGPEAEPDAVGEAPAVEVGRRGAAVVELEELLAGVTEIERVVQDLADDHVAGLLRERRTGGQQEHERQRQDAQSSDSGGFTRLSRRDAAAYPADPARLRL